MHPEDVHQMEQFLFGCVLMSCDIETIPNMGLMNVIGFSGLHADGRIETYVVGFYNSKDPSSGVNRILPLALPVIAALLASEIPKTFHNGAYDIFWLIAYNMPTNRYDYDSMVMWWSAFPELPKDLAFVSSILLPDYVYWKGDRKADSWVKFLIYNGMDCERTLRNTVVMIQGMVSKNTEAARIRRNFIAAIGRVNSCIAMSLKGLGIDRGNLDKHAKTLEALAAEKLERLRFILADPDFNPNSPAQKSNLLYRKLGAKPRNAKGRFVKKIEEASTGAVAMRGLKTEHPIYRVFVDAISEAQEPAKQISNIINQRRPDWWRFYTSYNGVGTTTTRFSSSETPMKFGGNAQNIRTSYRDWIQADEGCFLLDVDLSAADDVFVTFESGDPRKIELFRSGKDSHSQNATLFFPNWEYGDIVAGKKKNEARIVHPIIGIRQITKKLSHGCNYLMAAMTLLMTTGRDAIVAAAKEVGHADAGYWSQDRLVAFCLTREELYRDYYTRFQRTGPDSWYSELRDEVLRTGGYTTAFGYFQRFIGDPWDDSTLRAVAATAGQASTAGRINDIIEELDLGHLRSSYRDGDHPDRGDESLRTDAAEFGCDIRLQSHDSLTYNVNPLHPNWKLGVDRIFKVMRRPVVIKNKLTGGLETFSVGIESNAGRHWGKAMLEIKTNTAQEIEDNLDSILAL